jgi:hypothetical protein
MRILYKYARPERVDVLQDKRIKFTQVSCFNDPFEGRPYFTSLLEQEAIDEVCFSGDVTDETRAFRDKINSIMRSNETREWVYESKGRTIGRIRRVSQLTERPFSDTPPGHRLSPAGQPPRCWSRWPRPCPEPTEYRARTLVS